MIRRPMPSSTPPMEIKQEALSAPPEEDHGLSVGDVCFSESTQTQAAIDKNSSPEELANASQEARKNPLGEGCGHSVRDLCFQESAPTQPTTLVDRKPSPEELEMASQVARKNPFGKGYVSTFGDFCLPEGSPTQQEIDEKPSPEDLAMASQAALAFGEADQGLTVPPVPLPVQSTLQQTTGETMLQLKIKNEPISDSDEPTLSTAHQQVKEEFSVSEMQESAPSIVQFSHEDFQENTTRTLFGSSLPSEVQTGSPPWDENAKSTGLLRPHSQAQIQQLQENVKIVSESQPSGLENPLLKKVLAIYQEKFPSSTPKQIQLQKTEKGTIAIIRASQEIKKPLIPTIHMPPVKYTGVAGEFNPDMPKRAPGKKLKIKAIMTGITKIQERPSKPKCVRKKSKHLTKVVPEEDDEAEEGWEEVTKDDDSVLSKEAKMEAIGEELNTEDEFRRGAEAVEEGATLLEEDSQVHDEKEDDEGEVMEKEEYDEEADEEDYEDGGDDSEDSDYKPSSDEEEEGNGKKDDEGEVIEKEECDKEPDAEDYKDGGDDSEDSDYKPSSDKEEAGNSKKRKKDSSVNSKKRKKDSSVNSKKRKKDSSLSGNEHPKHILKLQLAKTKQLRLECKLCKDTLFTVQDFQLHFEEKHPGEAEKLVSDLELTLERKRLAFGKQKEKALKFNKSKVGFVPEVDEDVLFELDTWSNILLGCPKCSSFIWYWHFKSHVDEHDDRKSKTCGKCGKGYASKRYLGIHQKRCLENQGYEICEICGKHVANVYSHLRRVHNNKTFTCKICNATFRMKCGLNRHMKVHSSVKEHVCEICGRGFSQASNMRGHMRQHTKEKPYKCDTCNKSFMHNVSLKIHQKRDHGMDPWVGSNTAAVGRRKKDRDDSNKTTAKKKRSRKGKTKG